MKKLIMQLVLTVDISGNWSIRDGKILHQMSVPNSNLMDKYSGTHSQYVISGDAISANCFHIAKMKILIPHTLTMLQSELMNFSNRR